MLAIFDGRVAKSPECMKMPHNNAVSALKDDFLIKYFTSIYPDSVVISSEASFTIAYSLGASSSSHLERYHFAHADGLFCMYKGFIKDINAVKRDFNISEIDDEGLVMIRAFQILRQLGQIIPKKAVEDMSGNCVSAFFEIPSKLVVLAGGSNHNLPIYWGTDARFNLVISDSKKVVEKACGSVQDFLSGQVYACCNGRTGHEALFLKKQLRFKVDFTDKCFPISQPVETVSKMILEADSDRSERHVQKWKPPLPDFVKINTDAIKFSDGMIGIGIVIRNSKGEVELATTRRAEDILPDLDPELQAFMEGFYLAAEFKFPRCICESAHDNMEKSLASEIIETLLWVAGDYIVENLSEFSVCFVHSSANNAAHCLALHAKTNEDIFWWKKTPECIAAIVESERPTIDNTISS